MNIKLISRILLCLFLFVFSVYAQNQVGTRPTGSGGVLIAEQAAYDVKHYDLNLRVNPDEQSISGVLTVRAQIVSPIDKFVLDLDTPLAVQSVTFGNAEKRQTLNFERRGDRIWIALPGIQKAGKTINVTVAYGGKPRVAPNPPWVGGFVWSKTPSGAHWIATAVQMDGSDLWFPVKDHPSDKPETVSLLFTVPEPLVAASNGRLQSVVKNPDGTQTFHWFVSQPISNYNIALNAAPYKVIKDEMKSIAGDTIPIEFYVLPEDFDKGQGLVDKTKDYVRFFEEYLGPYPFRADKLGIAHTPHLGMEHQSIIAYGNHFKYDQHGFDWLMFHELGHEWWANLVTAPDWNDFWIHEGFQSFFDAYYAEKRLGREQFIKSLPNKIKSTRNIKPVAPREPRSTTEMYFIPPDYIRTDNDIYGKGALILNTLRGLIGDDAFFRAVRKTVYPTPKMEKITNGKQVQFVTTDDFLKIAERESGKKLDWFFELYLRQPKLPTLVSERQGNQLVLGWDTPGNMPFPMPVEVKIGNEIRRVEMPNGRGMITLTNEAAYLIDPNGWLLKSL
jgi:aminopeptidase N